MKYIYGPVPSRRLGLSLGVSLTPHKTCNFDCIYCQLGGSKQVVADIKEYIPVTAIFEEVQLWLKNNPQKAQELKFITLSGCGEPTLNTGIGQLIGLIKKGTSFPVCLITNASTMGSPEIRRQVLGVDLIVPSLDAADTSAFQKINRPHASVKLDEIIEGLVALRREYRGQIWLEVMIVRGVNDELSQARKIKEQIDRIRPDRIQINSPVRSTTEKDVVPAEEKRLLRIKEIFGDRAEIV